MLSEEDLHHAFAPVFADLRERATVAESFIDRNLYQVYVATLWSNVVLSPDEVGITEDDLETLHNVLVVELKDVLGADASLTTVFEFINSKPGEATMREARLNQTHKDLLQYFSSMILDPDGHKKWMDELREKL